MYKKIKHVAILIVLVAGSFLLANVYGSEDNILDHIPEDAELNEESLFYDIPEDANLDAPQLIAKYGYPVEVHHVTTSDGYILEAHRIPHGKERNNHFGQRPVVFVFHGLMSSSMDFVVQGPGVSLAYLLAEEGYDVWLGNARGNFYSRNHTTLNPNKSKFWVFSWDEIGVYDLSAFVEYILEVTGEEKLHYIGHSQGGTTFLVLNSIRTSYNDKFKSFHGLAPASYFNHNTEEQFRVWANFIDMIELFFYATTKGEFATNKQARLYIQARYCPLQSIYSPACIEAMRNISSNMLELNTTMIKTVISHTPAGAAIKQFGHYGQVIHRGKFARYDYNFFKNLILYGRSTPPEYNVTLITVPSYLYYGMADESVNYLDLLTLSKNLPNVKETYQVEREDFNHLDFLLSPNVKTEVYDHVIANLKRAESDK